MKERTLTLLGALAALLLATGLLLHRPAHTEPLSRPTSTDRGEHGYAGLQQWLGQAGVTVVAAQDRWVRLKDEVPAATGNMLIVTLPAVYSLRRSELPALQSWIVRGNDLMLNLPPQAADESRSLLARLGLHLSRNADADADAEGCPPARGAKKSAPLRAFVRLVPITSEFSTPLLNDVHEIHANETGIDSAAKTPRLSPAYAGDGDQRLPRYWLCEAVTAQAALWQFRVGAGRVWIATRPGWFANGKLAEADNARLFANLLRLSLQPGGSVIFDDFHQGESRLYDPARFFADPRLHASLALMLAAWLLYVLGSNNRYAPARPTQRALSQREFAETLGGYLAHTVKPPLAAKELLQQLHARIRRRGAQRADGGLWAALAASPHIDATLIHALQAEAQALREGRSRDLRRLSHLIKSIEGALE